MHLIDTLKKSIKLSYLDIFSSALASVSLLVLSLRLSLNQTGRLSGVSSSLTEIAMNEEVEDTLKMQKIKTDTFPSSPTWLNPEVNCCEKIISKKNQCEYEIKASFVSF